MTQRFSFYFVPLNTAVSTLTLPRTASEARRVAQDMNRRAQDNRAREERERDAFGDRLRQLERAIQAAPSQPRAVEKLRAFDCRRIGGGHAAR